MKIAFLTHDVCGLGGTIHSTLKLASALADRHQVEIAAVGRYKDAPAFAVDPRIPVVQLVDLRPGGQDSADPDFHLPSEIVSPAEPRADRYSRLADRRVAAWLRTLDADVVIGTRPSVNFYLARLGPAHAVRLGQEHVGLERHTEALQQDMAEQYALLDAVVTVSEADARAFREQVAVPGLTITHIGNPVPAPGVPPSDGRAKVVAAAGRLVPGKRFELLIEAFAKVAAEHPDWQLRIYGKGQQRAALRARIDELGLYNHVLLMGAVPSLAAEWPKASIAASMSAYESFGLTLVEAMRAGLAVVSTDCDQGPREIITDGTDGVLVPVDDVAAFAAALGSLIGDEERRRTMAAAALRKALRWDPAAVVARYEELIGVLLAEKAAPKELGAHRLGDDALTFFTAGAADGGPLHLIGRRRGLRKQAGKAPAALRIPFTAAKDTESGGRLEAVLRRGEHKLAEGHWDFWLESGADDSVRRARAAACDLRPVAPSPEAGPVEVWLPYVTDEGHLSLRTWLREAHAEVAYVLVGGADVTVHGRLYGIALPPAAGLVVRRRGEQEEFRVPVAPAADGSFAARIPYGALAERRQDQQTREIWDLYLAIEGQKPLRLGRILDDVMVKKQIYQYPPVLHAGARVRVFYTVRNGLSLLVRNPDEEGPADSPADVPAPARSAGRALARLVGRRR
ncbi:glycosyltransferase family 4 protein [Streptomyces sp. A7024]|uniref:D-inositol 3-phosphate glycosyltransferase n=1 Tax=Streptomyces coryli TaxID=1128680 RepID=A0A6G4TZY3_9ACTN|nr:glycosyltransferase [Streptomyces coryli]NGN65070.1 glycosyltransferase family 4 protein [Streptomyces coryli]